MAFIIVAGILIVINAIFLIGSLIYTLKVSKSKGEPRLSVLDHRMSLQPQVVFYDAIVSQYGNPSVSQQQLEEMSDNKTKQAA